MKKITVLITDDSVVYRSQIRAALTDIPWIEIVGTASNGKIALDRLQQTPTDLLILDLEMPEMDGVQTLKEIALRKLNCKVLVFSSASQRGAETKFEALRLGAYDFITKPGPVDATDPQFKNPSDKIRSVLEPKISFLFKENLEIKASPLIAPSMVKPTYPHLLWELFQPQVIVIGSSTGGPTVLETIFSEIRGPLKCPILIAQHMPPIFTATLAERLQKLSGIPTREGSHGTPLETNSVTIAPGDFHMTISGTKERPGVVLDQSPQVNSVRPAVDPLFSSAAAIYGPRCLGIVLTGMGSDGKDGAETIKRAGGGVLIQKESTCVVFGMPGAVMAAGAFDRAMDPTEIIAVIKEKAMSHLASLPNHDIRERR